MTDIKQISIFNSLCLIRIDWIKSDGKEKIEQIDWFRGKSWKVDFLTFFLKDSFKVNKKREVNGSLQKPFNGQKNRNIALRGRDLKMD